MATGEETSRVERVAEATWAKIVTRYLVPVGLAIAGYLTMGMLDEIKMGLKSFGRDLRLLSTSQYELKGSMDVLTETVRNNRRWSDEMDARFGRDLEMVSKRVDGIEAARREAIAR